MKRINFFEMGGFVLLFISMFFLEGNVKLISLNIVIVFFMFLNRIWKQEKNKTAIILFAVSMIFLVVTLVLTTLDYDIKSMQIIYKSILLSNAIIFIYAVYPSLKRGFRQE
jgi:glucan phosphoethanolaminetransferase (alkaline phosphatase superfamily)